MPPTYSADNPSPLFYMKNFIDNANLSEPIHIIGNENNKSEIISHIKSLNIFEEAKNIVNIILDIIKDENIETILVVTKNVQLINLIQNLLWQNNIEINNHITQNISVKTVISFFIKLADIYKTNLTADNLVQILKSPYVKYKVFELEAKIVHNKQHHFSIIKLIEWYKNKNEYSYLEYLEKFFIDIANYRYFSEFLTAQLKFFIYLVGDNKLPQNFLIFLEELKTLLKDTQVSPDDYSAMLKNFIGNHNFSEKLKPTSQVIVANISHALMIDSDLVIIPEFTDKIWPGSFHEDPWLTPDIRKSLNLSSEKSHIALNYYIFFCLSNRGKLYITNSEYYEGKPAIISRFLSKIANRVVVYDMNKDRKSVV
jgi:inactivated superfamily I helicase